MSTPAVTPNQNQTPPLNDLVTKVRAAHPGAYDDFDDATLTKKVLAKYPQYSDLAAPKAAGAPPPLGTLPDSNGKAVNPNTARPKTIGSGEGPVAQGLTTMETKLADIPAGVAHLASSKRWPVIDSRNFSELGNDLKAINPIDTNEGSIPMDIGGTAANLLPFAIDAEGVGKSRIGRTTAVASEAVPKIEKTAAELGRPAEELPVIGGVIKAAKATPEAWRNIKKIWNPEPAPVYPGAPLPPTPPQELLQARTLERGAAAPPPEPSAGLSKIPVRQESASPQEPIAANPTDIPHKIPPDKSFNPKNQGETIRSGEGVENIPHPITGEGALSQILTGQDNANLLKIAKSRGINVTKEAQLKPGAANGALVKKIVSDFSPEELDEIRSKYLESTRFRHGFGDVGPEAWKTMSLQTYFPDLKIPAATLKRTSEAISGAKKTTIAPPGEDLTNALKASVKQAKAKSAD